MSQLISHMKTFYIIEMVGHTYTNDTTSILNGTMPRLRAQDLIPRTMDKTPLGLMFHRTLFKVIIVSVI